MQMNDFFSDERIMQASTRLVQVPNYKKEYSNAVALIKGSKDFTEDEKKFILSFLAKLDPNQSFTKKYIGFNN